MFLNKHSCSYASQTFDPKIKVQGPWKWILLVKCNVTGSIVDLMRFLCQADLNPESKIFTAGAINIPQCQHCSCYPRKLLLLWICWWCDLNTCQICSIKFCCLFFFLSACRLILIWHDKQKGQLPCLDWNAKNRLSPVRWWILLALLFMSNRCPSSCKCAGTQNKWWS